MSVPKLTDLILKDPTNLVHKLYGDSKIDNLFHNIFSHAEHTKNLRERLPRPVADRLSDSVLTRYWVRTTARGSEREAFTNKYSFAGDERNSWETDVLVIEAYYRGVTYEAHYTYEYVENEWGRTVAGMLFVYMITIRAPLPVGERCEVSTCVKVPYYVFHELLEDWHNRPQLIRTYTEHGDKYDDDQLRMDPHASRVFGDNNSCTEIDINPIVIDAIERLETNLLGNYHHSQNNLESLYGPSWKEHITDSPVKIGIPMWEMERDADDQDH